MKKFFMVAVAAMSLTVMQASAALIFGSVGINGNIVTPVLGGANSLTFSSLPGGIEGMVTTSTGDLYVAFGTAVNTSAMTLGPNVVGFVFDFGGIYTFTASSFNGATLVSNVANEGSRSVLLNGMYAKGADSNAGSLRISFQNPQTGNPSTYSADGATVPEPGTYALLGSALLGLGFLRRRKA